MCSRLGLTLVQHGHLPLFILSTCYWSWMAPPLHRRCELFCRRPKPNAKLISVHSQILWLLYFTSEDDAAILRIFNAGSCGSFNQGQGVVGGRQGSQRASMAHGGAAVSYSGANSYSKAGGLGQGPAGMSVGELSGGGHHDDGRTPSMGGTSLIDGQVEPEYLMKARALYSCKSLSVVRLGPSADLIHLDRLGIARRP